MLAQSVQPSQPEITVAFNLDGQAVSTTRRQLMPSLNGRNIFIAVAHLVFPAIGGLRRGGESHVWQQIVFSDE
jgi:hypothetical protein